MPRNVTGEPPGSPRQHSSNGTASFHRSNSASFSRRPSSAPRTNGGANTTDEEEDNRLTLRPPKPPLLRSQSEYASPHRNQDDADHTDNEDFEWGARHGFEDHYQSEDIISQLANVSRFFFAFVNTVLAAGLHLGMGEDMGFRCQVSASEGSGCD
jgi:regulator-associated protein of mTOR